MDLERKFNQEMTVYRKTGTTGSGGPIVAAPIKVKCRWSTTSEQFITNAGEEVYVKAWISSSERFNQGDLVVLGDTTSETDPVEAGAEELKRDSEIPNLSAEEYLYIYFV